MFKEMKKAFKIFSHYGSGNHMITADDGKIYVETSTMISSEHSDKLNDLGWQVTMGGYWYLEVGTD